MNDLGTVGIEEDMLYIAICNPQRPNTVALQLGRERARNSLTFAFYSVRFY